MYRQKAVDFPVAVMDPWQAELSASYTEPRQLLSFLDIEPVEFWSDLAPGNFPFRVTRSFALRMRKGNPLDPLLLQVLPTAEESRVVPGFADDPVGDLQASVLPGVLHKYSGRVLLVATGACAINCRYCFRRSFPYREQQLTHSAEESALAYIAADDSIEEVILSGGDPLLLSDLRLELLIAALAKIPHLRRIRIHSRVPVVLPSRITQGFVTVLTSTRLTPVVVIHANHPNEWDSAVGQALQEMRRAGVTLLNQAVLLRGVNDDAATLAALSETFFASGALPYYLHLLDRACGTAHFEVPQGRAAVLHEQLRRRLPGYLVPRLVREEAGRPYKSWL